MTNKYKDIISSKEEFEAFRSTIGTPSPRAANKVISFIDEHCVEFIAKSPFLSLATSNVDGECDVSPRGDAPGFVTVLDEHHLFIPERPGNKRMDSMHNIITNPNIGLLFFMPGLGETLRINGKAYICRDPELLEKSSVNGKTPLFGILVEVKECYAHCAKAFLRSKLWDPDSWLSKEELPSVPKMLVAHSKLPNETPVQVAKDLHESYTKRLY
ncbi:pyridoxamine 5'-phosphate oxidase family protein [Aquibacillus koreensis]|uniref:Pyridoxamine 5'-phosphate oxidase family protein n=1 Tax=Aquibacillus koreensis TaxID=279446 RepID=A0A9X4AK01_9BACI|nr:pyridoxamine 5'-phosphate oxidase family protein [Aquibacillus koreensis]MCT2535381.1 pyridoxamine 5'-phosphate oxidase family protein [Aquibacillus koreensis]MDC3422546.1 pyridoxamine 5'-phosphate oxidase family protein [Aquibacillus koreensis]